MTRVEILTAIQKLSLAERLEIAESVLHALREEIALEQARQREGNQQRLERGAQIMLAEYGADPELTAFANMEAG